MERIEKLLALSKSSNPSEAAIALARAQKLMEEFKISSADVEINAITEEESAPMAGLKGRNLVCTLANTVCDCFGITFFYESSSSGTVGKVTFIGPKDRIASGIYVFTFLQRQLKNAREDYRKENRRRLEQEYLDRYERCFKERPNLAYEYRCVYGKRPTRNNLKEYDEFKKSVRSALEKGLRFYTEGWAEAVYQKVRKFSIDEQEMQLIEEYTQKYHPDLVESSHRTRYMSVAEANEYRKGVKDGSDGFDLYKGVNGMASPRLENF